MKNLLVIVAIISLGMWSCTQSPQKGGTKTSGDEAQFPGLYEKAKAQFSPLQGVAENPENPITPEKVLLGQTLYFEKRLSKDGNISCNSCHNMETYGVDNKPTSPGDAGELGGRNSPTVLNAALQFVQFWDGRAKDVEEQAGGPILNPVEMSMPDKDFVIKRLNQIKGYQEMFAAAFPGEKAPINYDNVQKAIADYERRMITPSHFDEYLSGNENALTVVEKQGLKTFMDVNCTMCHSGALLGGNMFMKFGLTANYWDHTNSPKIDEGRFQVTKSDADKYIFKVSQLRNIEKTYPYFHDGMNNNLEDAVKVMAKVQLGKNLTPQEVQDIVSFLNTLTGKVPPELVKVPPMPV